MKKIAPLLLIAAMIAVVVIAGDPRTNNPNPEPPRNPPSVTNGARPMPPRLNRMPQQLESVAQATNAPLAEATNTPAPPTPKLIGIVMRDVYAVQANPSTPPLIVVPERYLHDLTNIYRHQFIPVLRLEEP